MRPSIYSLGAVQREITLSNAGYHCTPASSCCLNSLTPSSGLRGPSVALVMGETVGCETVSTIGLAYQSVRVDLSSLKYKVEGCRGWAKNHTYIIRASFECCIREFTTASLLRSVVLISSPLLCMSVGVVDVSSTRVAKRSVPPRK